MLQNRDARRGCQRISRKRTRLINFADRRQTIHDLFSTKNRGERKTAADDLPRVTRSG